MVTIPIVKNNSKIIETKTSTGATTLSLTKEDTLAHAKDAFSVKLLSHRRGTRKKDSIIKSIK